jgi:hypothetical protein
MDDTRGQLRLTVDVTALQKLPATTPTPEGAVMLGAQGMRCSIDQAPTCCCTRLTDW